MITTVYKLICTHCGKKEEYIDSYPHNQHKPKNWYSLQPNYRHSEWLTYNPGICDFCTLECIVAYIDGVIEERDNPVDKIYIAEMEIAEDENLYVGTQ